MKTEEREELVSAIKTAKDSIVWMILNTNMINKEEYIKKTNQISDALDRAKKVLNN